MAAKAKEVKPYESYSYCKAVNCNRFVQFNKPRCSEPDPRECIKTARQLHRWLKDNNYMIVKVVK